MPSTKDFKKTNAKSIASSVEGAPTESKKKRRPGRSPEPEVQVVDVEAAPAVEPQVEESSGAVPPSEETPKVELSFYGSEILRARFPKPFEVAETIATDWVYDGKFEGLPLGHPLAQFFASQGLQKAKKIEKQILESPVTEKVAMKAFEVGLKAQTIVQEVKSKLGKR
ncbi:MAG: hypothetical protein LW875_10580 [Proteobacteria bacterium]|jgi:hypothetical protein|nr:hypothetical protein [Pseudomonadota bacterium]